MSTEQQIKEDEGIENILKNLEEIKSIGISINETLVSQSEQLDNINTNVDKTTDTMISSNNVISNIELKSYYSKLLPSIGLGVCLIPVIGIKLGAIVSLSTFIISKL